MNFKTPAFIKRPPQKLWVGLVTNPLYNHYDMQHTMGRLQYSCISKDYMDGWMDIRGIFWTCPGYPLPAKVVISSDSLASGFSVDSLYWQLSETMAFCLRRIPCSAVRPAFLLMITIFSGLEDTCESHFSQDHLSLITQEADRHHPAWLKETVASFLH